MRRRGGRLGNSVGPGQRALRQRDIPGAVEVQLHVVPVASELVDGVGGRHSPIRVGRCGNHHSNRCFKPQRPLYMSWCAATSALFATFCTGKCRLVWWRIESMVIRSLLSSADPYLLVKRLTRAAVSLAPHEHRSMTFQPTCNRHKTLASSSAALSSAAASCRRASMALGSA